MIFYPFEGAYPSSAFGTATPIHSRTKYINRSHIPIPDPRTRTIPCLVTFIYFTAFDIVSKYQWWNFHCVTYFETVIKVDCVTLWKFSWFSKNTGDPKFKFSLDTRLLTTSSDVSFAFFYFLYARPASHGVEPRRPG